MQLHQITLACICACVACLLWWVPALGAALPTPVLEDWLLWWITLIGTALAVCQPANLSLRGLCRFTARAQARVCSSVVSGGQAAVMANPEVTQPPLCSSAMCTA